MEPARRFRADSLWRGRDGSVAAGNGLALVLLWEVPLEKVKVEQPVIQRDSSPPGTIMPDSSQTPVRSRCWGGGVVAVVLRRLLSW